MKVLNLYACLGGNRYKWDEVDPNIEVTAIELDSELAKLYQERFPNDNVIVADAHQYLLDHYKDFDFIWSSPPCPTHSKLALSNKNQVKAKYPSMTLYEEIILLQYYFDGKYVVENVKPYYNPLIPAKQRDRHLYWCNFNLPTEVSKRAKKKGFGISQGSQQDEFKKLCKFHQYDFNRYKGKQPKIKIARNLVDYEAGKNIFEAALIAINGYKVKQGELF